MLQRPGQRRQAGPALMHQYWACHLGGVEHSMQPGHGQGLACGPRGIRLTSHLRSVKCLRKDITGMNTGSLSSMALKSPTGAICLTSGSSLNSTATAALRTHQISLQELVETAHSGPLGKISHLKGDLEELKAIPPGDFCRWCSVWDTRHHRWAPFSVPGFRECSVGYKVKIMPTCTCGCFSA